MTYTITKDCGYFAAAHTLPFHDGGCANLHGHNYRVEVTLIGNPNISREAEHGMIRDFTALKESYKRLVHDVLDHSVIIPHSSLVWPKWYRSFVDLMGAGYEDIHEGREWVVTAMEEVDALLGKVAHINVPDTTAEYLAHWIWSQLHQDFGKSLLSVRVWETETSYAEYKVER